MKIALIFAVAGFSAARLAAAPVDWSKLPPASTVAGVTFDKDIAPILKDSCVRCHGAERPRAQLRLDSLDGVLQGAKQGPVVKTGDSANSLLVKAVSQLDPEIAMPPKPRARRGGPGGPPGTNAPAVPPVVEPCRQRFPYGLLAIVLAATLTVSGIVAFALRVRAASAG